jgi:hypothetical protein
MTARSIRRAQERKAKKLERKAANSQANEPATAAIAVPEEIVFDEFESLSFEPIAEPAPLSPARLAANQANAQLSSGPRSKEGKAKSSLNAVKSALTGRTVLLPTDDVAEYESFSASFERELRPVGQQEGELVQSIADSYWRIRRIGTLEMSIFAQGHIQFADQFDDHEPAARRGLVELHTFLHYEKQLRNLQLQEARLQRRREKDLIELRRLQQERDQREKTELQMAAKLYLAAKHDKQPFHPAEHGFEFSIADIESFLSGVRATNIARATMKKEIAQAA